LEKDVLMILPQVHLGKFAEEADLDCAVVNAQSRSLLSSRDSPGKSYLTVPPLDSTFIEGPTIS
jgi:hypothetical protein